MAFLLEHSSSWWPSSISTRLPARAELGKKLLNHTVKSTEAACCLGSVIVPGGARKSCLKINQNQSRVMRALGTVCWRQSRGVPVPGGNLPALLQRAAQDGIRLRTGNPLNAFTGAGGPGNLL